MTWRGTWGWLGGRGQDRGWRGKWAPGLWSHCPCLPPPCLPPPMMDLPRAESQAQLPRCQDPHLSPPWTPEGWAGAGGRGGGTDTRTEQEPPLHPQVGAGEGSPEGGRGESTSEHLPPPLSGFEGLALHHAAQSCLRDFAPAGPPPQPGSLPSFRGSGARTWSLLKGLFGLAQLLVQNWRSWGPGKEKICSRPPREASAELGLAPTSSLPSCPLHHAKTTRSDVPMCQALF